MLISQDQMKESEEIDPEQPESVDNEVKEEDEIEKKEENEETTTMKGSFEEDEDEDDNDSPAIEGGNVEEIAEVRRIRVSRKDILIDYRLVRRRERRRME